jgi:hypothetical protein
MPVFSNITKWKVCILQHYLKKISTYMARDDVSSVPVFPQTMSAAETKVKPTLEF